MWRKIGLLGAALAMFAIAGGHWAVLQTVAWAGMLADYTRESGSLAVGVEQTFDGEHPCELCKEIAVAKGRETSRPEPSSPTAGQKFKAGKSKSEGVLAENGFQLRLTVGRLRWFAPSGGVLSTRREAPPVPPPRSFVA